MTSKNTKPTLHESAFIGNTWRRVFSGKLALYTVVLNLAVGLFALDTLVVITVMPSVVGDIGGAEYYSWTIMLYMVGSIVGASSAGPIKNLFGRRNGYVYAGLLFVIGNLGVSLAMTMPVLVGWRLLEGLGAGLMIAQSYGMVGDVYPKELRVRILSVISTTWGVATVVGPAFGGLFAELGIWRAAFWTLIPLGLTFCALAWWIIPPSRAFRERSNLWTALPLVRLVSLGGSILCIGYTSQTSDNAGRAALVLAAIVLAVTAFRRDARSKSPMFPPGTLVIFSAIGSAYWILLLITMSFNFATLFATLYLQVLHGQAPIVAAYLSAALSFSWTTSAILVSGMQGRLVWVSIFTGVISIFSGSVVLAWGATAASIIFPTAGLVLVGVGMGLANGHLVALAILAAPEGQESLAGSSVQTMRTLGIGFGAAAAGMVANAAGLADAGIVSNTKGEVRAEFPELVVTAVDWVHRGEMLLSAAAVLVTVVFFIHGRHLTKE